MDVMSSPGESASLWPRRKQALLFGPEDLNAKTKSLPPDASGNQLMSL